MVPIKAKAGATPSDLKVGGRLRLYANAWRHDRWAYKVVSRGLSWAWLPGRPTKRVSRGQPSTPLIEDYVLDMLGKGSIESVPSELIVRSHLFSVPIKDFAESQMVLDLSALNQFFQCPTFRMTSVKTVSQVLVQGSVIVILNLGQGMNRFNLERSRIIRLSIESFFGTENRCDLMIGSEGTGSMEPFLSMSDT